MPPPRLTSSLAIDRLGVLVVTSGFAVLLNLAGVPASWIAASGVSGGLVEGRFHATPTRRTDAASRSRVHHPARWIDT